MTSRFLHISRAATLITLVVMAWQVSLPLDPLRFDAHGFALPNLISAIQLGEVTALSAIIAYALAGWPNRAVLHFGWRRVFVLALLGLMLFEVISIAWSPNRSLAIAQVLHMAVWAAFALLIACAEWPATTMAFTFLLGLLLHSAAGFIQIIARPVVEAIPQNEGVSVVFNGLEHWQRVYGLSPHPNILGGYLAVGAILTVGLIFQQQHAKRSLLIGAWLILWMTLLLTFSRSAWLAVMGGGIVAVTLLIRGRHLTRSLSRPVVVLSGLGMTAVVIFGVWFQPFLVNRIDVTAIPYETQAITDRLNAAQLALHLFAARPLLGAGIAQSIIVARDLLGTAADWIHNVPLLIATELGVVGSILIGLMLIALGAIGVQYWRTRSIPIWPALVGGALIALLIAMQFDHYVWTSAQGGLLWAWLVGWWLRVNSTRRTETTRRAEMMQSYGMLRN